MGSLNSPGVNRDFYGIEKPMNAGIDRKKDLIICMILFLPTKLTQANVSCELNIQLILRLSFFPYPINIPWYKEVKEVKHFSAFFCKASESEHFKKTYCTIQIHYKPFLLESYRHRHNY